MKIKDYIIILLSIALAIVSYLYFTREIPVNDNELIKKEVESLRNENNQLRKDFLALQKDNDSITSVNDSLSIVKQKEKIKYVNRTKEIDAASAGTIVNDLNRIFTKNNIE